MSASAVSASRAFRLNPRTIEMYSRNGSIKQPDQSPQRVRNTTHRQRLSPVRRSLIER
jgi:hypothetical protein